MAERKDSPAKSEGSALRGNPGPGSHRDKFPGRLLGGWDGICLLGPACAGTRAASSAEENSRPPGPTGWSPHNWDDNDPNVTFSQPPTPIPSPATPTPAIPKDWRGPGRSRGRVQEPAGRDLKACLFVLPLVFLQPLLSGFCDALISESEGL